MKIAFVGKGGSGKSTLASLFIRHLQKKGNSEILAIDADLNMSLGGLLGAKVTENHFISSPDAADSIRTYLKGENLRIDDVSKFLPTTPPGDGSNLIESAQEKALEPYAVRVASNPTINLLTVGTYEAEGIGQSCYHVNLFVAENILSHTRTNPKFYVVSDMVAGTDAFAYSLHLQFDAIILIAEPTPESVSVCRLYLDLATEAGVESLVHLVANKIEDDRDVDFIRGAVGREPLVIVPVMKNLKLIRQLGEVVTIELLTPELETAMNSILEIASRPAITASIRLKMLHELHRKLNSKKWVQLGYGDLQNQLDLQFEIEKIGATV